MKIEALLNSVTDVLMSIKVGGKRGDDQLAQLDRGILDVALMIAALDGQIMPAEVAAYYRLLGKCRGCAKKDAPAALDAALHRAGYLIARKQLGTDDKGCLEAFVHEAMDALPDGFGAGSLADLRRAFVFWTTMSISDGSYSALERSAIRALADGFAKVRCAYKSRKADKPSVVPLLEPDFLDKVEKLVKDLSLAGRREKAQAALDALINTVNVPEKDGVVQKPASSVTVRAGLVSLLIAAGISCTAMASDTLPFGATLFRIGF